MRINFEDKSPRRPIEIDPGQRRIHPLLRAAILRRDNYTCRYCRGHATEVDHVEPWAHGGLTVPANLAAACRCCNRSKGDRTPQQWRQAQRTAHVLAALRHRRTRLGQLVLAAKRARPQRPSLAEILSAT